MESTGYVRRSDKEGGKMKATKRWSLQMEEDPVTIQLAE
jgi:hypothetical protein